VIGLIAFVRRRTFMSAIKAFITRHPVATYFALTFAISWGSVLVVAGPSTRVGDIRHPMFTT
jgi:hypothetical protein